MDNTIGTLLAMIVAMLFYISSILTIIMFILAWNIVGIGSIVKDIFTTMNKD